VFLTLVVSFYTSVKPLQPPSRRVDSRNPFCTLVRLVKPNVGIIYHDFSICPTCSIIQSINVEELLNGISTLQTGLHSSTWWATQTLQCAWTSLLNKLYSSLIHSTFWFFSDLTASPNLPSQYGKCQLVPSWKGKCLKLTWKSHKNEARTCHIFIVLERPRPRSMETQHKTPPHLQALISITMTATWTSTHPRSFEQYCICFRS